MHEQRACPIGPQNQFYWGHNVETQRTGMYKEPGTQCRYKGPILAENNAYSMDQSYGSWHVATCTYVQSLERALVTYKMKVILMGGNTSMTQSHIKYHLHIHSICLTAHVSIHVLILFIFYSVCVYNQVCTCNYLT